jgi:YHS domain-containing protein
MNSPFESRWKTVPAIIFGVIVLLCLSGVASSQSSAQDAVPVLEGLDPVMLVQGKEVQGNLKITLTRGDFQYMFASEDNKAAFEKDPARYEIQLDGSCARMGLPVRGNPDLYTVYQGRIYIFGSGECKTRFEAAPTNYLEGESGAKTKIALTPEGLKKGEALIEKAVTAMGSAKLIDGLTNYQEKSTTLQTRQQSDVEVNTNLTIVFPDRLRLDQVMPDYANPSTTRKATVVITATEAFAITPNGIRPVPEANRIDQEHEINRRPLAILRARKNASFHPAATGSAKVGETTVEQVAVEMDDTSYALGIDPTSGRILSLSYRRRGPAGNFGQITKVFSDFRTVDGVTLPFKVTASFDSQPWKGQSSTIESITINGKIDPTIFEKPKQSGIQ